METKITRIKKRDGTVVLFDQSKITNAIFKAAQSVGGKDRKTAQMLSDRVVAELEKITLTPSIEQIQDTVERILIEEGHASTAKAYIIYRQERSAIRKEKQLVLEKEEVDEVDKKFDVNALRVLKARYLRKDATGKLIETPKQLFTRVAVHAALPDLFYDTRVFDINSRQPVNMIEDFKPALHEEQYGIGKYKLNRYHLEALKRMYDRFNRNKQMKVTFGKFFDMIKKGEFEEYEKNVDEFYNLMTHKLFMPNTPAIANFGNPLGMGSACFVLDVPDSIDGIMETLKNTAIVFKAGGGMGYNFSKLRPEGDFVSSTGGVASGPLSFMRLFDTMTEVIKQGGIRRGANMGILNSNHPDIEKFITAKDGNKSLRNFNISVLIMSDFWKYYENDEPYPLVNPKDGKVVKYVSPRALFDKIVYQAWESAEPGVIFFDRVNDYNPFYKYLGPIVTTNPCGEVLLYPNEPCNLGSINVWAFAKHDDEAGENYVDWDALRVAVRSCTRFLDNVIDVNNFPLKAIEEMSLATRKIGLGVMGVANLLYELRLSYNSEEGRNFMEKLMEFVAYWSKIESIELAQKRGNLPYYDKSFYKEGRLPIPGPDFGSRNNLNWDKVRKDIRQYGIRNGYTTIIAPTGSISMIAGCSSGMEPVYSIVFEKNVKVGSFFYIDPAAEKALREEGLFNEKVLEDINRGKGSVQNIDYMPEKIRKTLVTAMDITPEEHIRALAAFQKWTDSSISKTNNFPAEATVENMRESYILAYKLGCKDVTVFRDTSIKDQVLVAPKAKAKEEEKIEVKPEQKKFIKESETGLVFGNGNGDKPMTKSTIKNCPECGTQVELKEGCLHCPGCGWGLCM
ncbi:adenosylcobalamin-dependent ribonucleoside-diphosphate reductase [Candidatus Woesearchaeota archaeon]|nr:adenosylcobalamin-dependent ribonucleoside-diphosphate reductase [Candidatus Woesearchaeota archaeon]